MKDSDCVEFLQWALPRLRMRWRGFRRVRKQVCKRIDRRLRELGLSDVAAYRDYLDAHQEEWAQLDSFCRISISRFYRDRGVFDLLRDEVLPMVARMARARGDHTLRCWSAGCASGEEVYTLSILWALCLSTRFPDLTLRLVATDSDSNMLDRARRGCYSASSLKEVSQDWLTMAFTRSDDVFCVKPEFRDHIELRLQDGSKTRSQGAHPSYEVQRFASLACRFDVSLANGPLPFARSVILARDVQRFEWAD